MFGIRKKQKLPKNTQFVWARSYRRYDREMYHQYLLTVAWSTVLEADNPDLALDEFYRILLAIIEKHATYKYIKTIWQRKMDHE